LRELEALEINRIRNHKSIYDEFITVDRQLS
jgi:hypothetical protein